MAKHFLNNTEGDLDFLLIGISCSEDQYTTVAIIEDSLRIRLSLSDYIPYNLKEGRIFTFSLYRSLDEELGLEYCFIPNTSNFDEPNVYTAGNDLFAGINVDESLKLVKELPKTDYFLILKGEDLHNYQHKIIDKLKAVPEILQASAIEPQELPSRRNLIF